MLVIVALVYVCLFTTPTFAEYPTMHPTMDVKS